MRFVRRRQRPYKSEAKPTSENDNCARRYEIYLIARVRKETRKGIPVIDRKVLLDTFGGKSETYRAPEVRDPSPLERHFLEFAYGSVRRQSRRRRLTCAFVR